MSQPEMQPEGGASSRGSTKHGAGYGTGHEAGHGTGRGTGRDGLLGRAFPLGDWGEPEQRLDELYAWVEQGALRIVDRYLHERVRKRRAARVLRIGAAAGVVAGTGLPLLELTGAIGTGHGVWGFPALLGAAACVACDRCFGLTSGWMRDVATAQAVQRRLQALQYDWAAESIREVLGPAEGTAGEAAERCLGVLRRFADDVTGLVQAETADWMTEYGAGLAPLRGRSGPAPEGGGRPGAQSDAHAPQVPRLPLPPGTRPTMPRQRPPEGPR